MAELCKLEIEVRLPEGEKLNSLMGSVFHGLLMDIAGAHVAAWLHQQSSCRTFSQCVFFDKEKNIPIWRICTLSETGYSRIVLPLLDRKSSISNPFSFNSSCVTIHRTVSVLIRLNLICNLTSDTCWLS